ncbi:MAG: TnpV protein [Elusimicrobiaceae bacterium]|nr:TnpV protein [Elusimicrobiaceae bacterium]
MELHYKQIGDQFYPELKLPEQTDYQIGKYGNLHLTFLKSHRRGTYTTLLTEGRLNEHLHAIDEQAATLLETEITQRAERNGVTEELKAIDQMRWVQEMNNIRTCAEEFVLREVVYR